jgi:hypothetical protein
MNVNNAVCSSCKARLYKLVIFAKIGCVQSTTDSSLSAVGSSICLRYRGVEARDCAIEARSITAATSAAGWSRAI